MPSSPKWRWHIWSPLFWNSEKGQMISRVDPQNKLLQRGGLYRNPLEVSWTASAWLLLLAVVPSHGQRHTNPWVTSTKIFQKANQGNEEHKLLATTKKTKAIFTAEASRKVHNHIYVGNLLAKSTRPIQDEQNNTTRIWKNRPQV